MHENDHYLKGAAGAGLGFIDPATAASAYALYQQIAPLFSNRNDPGRFSRSEGWYLRAVQGDEVAECLLKHHSGADGGFGPGVCGGQPSTVVDTGDDTPGSAGSRAASRYNYALYRHLQAAKAGTIGPVPERPDGQPSSLSQLYAPRNPGTIPLPGGGSVSTNAALAVGIGAVIVLAMMRRPRGGG